MTHSYLGHRAQSTIEIKQHGDKEAARKLRQMGSALRHSVLAQEMVAINGNDATSCRLFPNGIFLMTYVRSRTDRNRPRMYCG